MRGLTVRQPHARLIEIGEKTIELRSWATRYRGDLLICSAARPDYDLWYPTGVTICLAELWDVREFLPEDAAAGRSKWRRGLHSWRLRNVRPVENLPIKGALGLFAVPSNIERRLLRAA